MPASGEINNFWIVTMYLTPSQAELLVQAKEIDGQLLARRQFYINPANLETLEQGERMEIDIVQER